MKILKFLLKLCSFIPAALMIWVIFHFSSQSGQISGSLSLKITTKLVHILNQLFYLKWSPSQIEALIPLLHPLVRKLAHVSEYFVLAMCISFPLYVFRLRGFALTLLAGTFCVGIAALDEFHQLFVNGRGGSPRDVLIDSIGILIGILVVRLLCFAARKSIFED